MGAIYAGASDEQYRALSRYGEHIGLAFQIVDDILDVEESSEALGKTAGKDAEQHKITFPAVYGLEVRAAWRKRNARAPTRCWPRSATAPAPARAGRPDRPPQVMKATRLDRLMVERGLAESREKAQALIMAGEVWWTGRRPRSPASRWLPMRRIEVLARPPYVGRGGFKLAAALHHFGIDVAGGCVSTSAPPPAASRTACCRPAPRACMRWMSARASSTGSCAPIRAWWCMRGVNARYLQFGDIGERVDLAVCDVSFISVTLILPAVSPLLRPDGANGYTGQAAV